jgi:regulator of sigma D
MNLLQTATKQEIERQRAASQQEVQQLEQQVQQLQQQNQQLTTAAAIDDDRCYELEQNVAELQEAVGEARSEG